MAGGLDNLSADSFKRLSETLNEAKELLKQQEVQLQRTLDMEQSIINRRIAGLKQYNDEYSKLLNSIASEHDALRAEMFQINESGKEAAENAKKAAESAKQAQASSGSQNDGAKAVGSTVTKKQRGALADDSITTKLNKHKDLDAQINATIKREKDAVIDIEQLKDARRAKREEMSNQLHNREVELENTITALTMSRLQEKADRDNQLRSAQLSHMQEMASAELRVQELKNEMAAEEAYAASPEAAEQRARYLNAIEEEKDLNELKKQLADERLELEQKARRKYNGQLTAEALREVDEEYKRRLSNTEELEKRKAKIRKQREKDEKKEKEEKDKNNRQKADQVINNAMSFDGLSKENNVIERFKSMKELVETATAEGFNETKASIIVGIKALSSLAQQLEKKIDDIASNKGLVDTRLQGSSKETTMGSYWDKIVHEVTRVGAINPFFKQEDFAKNIKGLVEKGIAFDLEQRAFLMTIKDKIATTFDVADGTLLRLIRIQQADTTAGRLGMESALNAFLNNMYETTEYLESVARGVRSSLQEMQSLMEADEAAEVEYQVQKWLGSLYSVGMSDTAVNSISNALGQIAAGQIEGLTNGGTGNLLIMAANDAGMSIADILTEGINSSDTNMLLQSAVNYLAELANSAQDNKVVQQQLADVFGVKASDLKAATNLTSKGSVGNIYSNSLAYSDMLNQLFSMAGSMWARTSIAEMMTNLWENGQYTLAGSMASNPISYFIYKMATVLDNTAGGIAIPGISIVGNMVDLETTVADLMRVAAVGTGVIGSIGAIVQGIGNSFSGRAMLEQLGISSGSGIAITPRGSGVFGGSTGGGVATVSESGYAGNASGSDIKDSTMQEANDSKKQLMIEAKEEEGANQLDVLNSTVLKIYELLEDVARGDNTIKVEVKGYGLTKAGNGNSSIGGVSALDNLGGGSGAGGLGGSNGGSGGGGGGSLSSGGVNSNSASGSINFGGWTTTV